MASTVEFPPITIVLADGTSLCADIWPADLYRLEEQSNISLPALGGSFSFRHLLPLAWFALRRNKQIPIEWTIDDFVDRVKDLDIDDSAAGPKATLPAPSTG